MCVCVCVRVVVCLSVKVGGLKIVTRAVDAKMDFRLSVRMFKTVHGTVGASSVQIHTCSMQMLLTITRKAHTKCNTILCTL